MAFRTAKSRNRPLFGLFQAGFGRLCANLDLEISIERIERTAWNCRETAMRTNFGKGTTAVVPQVVRG
jgi:hypothetical protein